MPLKVNKVTFSSFPPCGSKMYIRSSYKDQTFRKDDLVHIFVGTEAGVRAKKTEPVQAKFKGVKGELFLCRVSSGYWFSARSLPVLSAMVGA